MATCDCGRAAGHLKMRFSDSDGRFLPTPVTICPECKPDEFTEKAATYPGNQKVYTMDEVVPNEYEYVNGKKQLKDWAQNDLEQKIGREDPDEVAMRERAKDKKRQQAREVRTAFGTKLDEGMIRRIDEAIKSGRERGDIEESGLVLP